MKLMVFGGRDFEGYLLAENSILSFLEELGEPLSNVEIVEGGAKGADFQGKSFAITHDLCLHTFKADWKDLSEPCKIKVNTYGKYNSLAGMKRNSDMVNIADAAIGFWDGKSKGTLDSINKLKKKGIPLKIVEYTDFLEEYGL